MSRVAVIGAGISGMAAAYYLSRRHEVWLFEREPRLGGHTHTVRVDTPLGALGVDTGFIVFNERNYPNLIALFDELGVASQPSDMSFSVSNSATGFQYSSRGAGGFFADRANLFRVAHYRLLADIGRFHRRARRLLPGAAGRPVGAGSEEPGGGPSLEEWLEQERFSRVVPNALPLPDDCVDLVDGPRPGRGVPGADDGAVLRQPRPAADGGESPLASRPRRERHLHPAR